MIDQNTFLETLRGVSEIVRTAPTPMTEEEILSYFSEMELSEEQREMIFQYMQLPAEMRGEQPDIEPEEAADEQAEEENEAQQKETAETETTIEKLSDSQFYRMYLDEVKQIAVSKDSELRELYERLLSGDDSVRETILNSWLLQVMEIAKHYSGGKLNMEDVIQEGNMGLWTALADIPTEITADTMSLYLTDSIQKAMQDYIHEITGDSDGVQTLLGKMSLLNGAKEYLKEENGREPSLRELSDYTQIPEEEIQDLMTLQKEQ